VTIDHGALAQASLDSFIEKMAAAGNPGRGRHDLGWHHVHGWILEYDNTHGGAEIQAVIGTDGFVHARHEGHEGRSLRARKCTAREWLFDVHAPNEKPAVATQQFVHRLSEILQFNGVEPADVS
jgi:hypothetical protein